MDKVRAVLYFLRYKIKAKHKNGHGIHSPFLFNLLQTVIFNESKYYFFEKIDSIRAELQKEKRVINVSDFGAGSKISKKNQRKIRSIAKYSSVNKKFGELYFKLVIKIKPRNIIEMGTSLGIGTLYLALADKKTQVHTIEACPETLNIAKENFKKFNINNINPILGKFDDVLPDFLKEKKTIDLVYFDGNHTKEATLKYFYLCLPYVNNESIFIFDDIYWSKGMTDAWAEIKGNHKVSLSLDLYRAGIIFFKKELSKQNFVIKF